MPRLKQRPPIVSFRARDSIGGALRIFRRESSRKPPHAGGMHGHRFFVLNYFDRGEGLVVLPREELRVAAGSVFLAPPGELHETSGLSRMGGWVIEFTADLLGGGTGAPSLLLPRRDGLPWLAFGGRRFDAPALAVVPAGERAEWQARLARLAREAAGASLGSLEAIRALLCLTLVDLARLLLPLARARPPSTSPLVREVLDVIDRRHGEPLLSLREVARAVARSGSHVTSVVRAQTGMTVLEWITERRMAEARKRLRETDEDVAIVAERSGYLGAAYFARLFKRLHGLTAREFRGRD